MPAELQCDQALLTAQEVEDLWQATRVYRNYPDEAVIVRCVDREEIQELNKTYRQKDYATNVLTFSYQEDDPHFLALDDAAENKEHDIAICLDIAEKEAMEQGVPLRDYFSLLLVHAFLHATGMDHEKSSQEEIETQEAEKKILADCGYEKNYL